MSSGAFDQGLAELRRASGGRIRVQKFGGASLKDGAAVERVCRLIAAEGGERPVVVVSAHEGVTRLLGRLAEEAALGRVDGESVRVRHRSILRELGLDSELLDRHLAQLVELLRDVARRRALDPRTRDHVLSFGERMSARVVAAALRRAGTAATPVDAFDLGLVRDGARPCALDPERLRSALASVPGVPVVTGFLAADASGQVTTLGRNGSDWTAALLAEALQAREVQLWKTVGGVLTADPALVPKARPIERLALVDALELAGSGASVLHPAAASTALRARIPVLVRDAERPASPGTRIELAPAGAGPVGLAHRADVALVEVAGAEARIALGSALARCAGEAGTATLVLSAAGHARAVLDEGPGLAALLGALDAQVRRGLALVTLVGGGAGEASEALAALRDADVAPLQTVCEPRRALFLVQRTELERAARALHAAFFEA